MIYRYLPVFASVIASFAALTASADSYVVIGFDLPQLKKDVEWERGKVSHDLTYHHGFVVEMSEHAAEKLQSKHGAFALIEKDYEAYAIGKPTGGVTQPAQSTPWGVTAVNAPSAWSVTRGRDTLVPTKRVRVCVVDTGIDATHPDLLGQVAGGENFVVQRGKINPSSWADDNNHGTHVSGTIAALDNGIGVVGVAPEAELFAAKVLNSSGSGSYSAIAEGIRSCVAHGAQVINMSIGGPSDSIVLQSAIIDASNAGVVLVAAAGNESADTSTSYPAAYPQVIAVSAVDSSNRLASFSNYGTKVAFSAPGVNVVSTVPGGTYAAYNGTSMASPHVAGVAALAVAAHSVGLLGHTIGLATTAQGAGGFIDSVLSVNNQAQ